MVAGTRTYQGSTRTSVRSVARATPRRDARPGWMRSHPIPAAQTKAKEEWVRRPPPPPPQKKRRPPPAAKPPPGRLEDEPHEHDGPEPQERVHAALGGVVDAGRR